MSDLTDLLRQCFPASIVQDMARHAQEVDELRKTDPVAAQTIEAARHLGVPWKHEGGAVYLDFGGEWVPVTRPPEKHKGPTDE